MLYCCLSVAVEKDFQILQCEALLIVVVLLWKGFPKHNVKLQWYSSVDLENFPKHNVNFW